MTLFAVLFVILISVGVMIVLLVPKVRKDYLKAGVRFDIELWLLGFISAIVLVTGVFGLLNEYLRWVHDGSVALFGCAIFAMGGLIVVSLFEYRGIERLRDIADQDAAS